MGIRRFDIEPMTAVERESGAFLLFTDHEQVVADLTKNHKENLDSWLAQRQKIDRLRVELAAKSKDAERLNRAIGIVCEGFTLPPDVYKILTKAMWSDAEIGEGNGR